MLKAALLRTSRSENTFFVRLVPARSLAGVLREVRERFPNDHLLLKVDAEGAECVLPFSESLDALRLNVLPARKSGVRPNA